MARNTNISEILFPVECKPVFLENQRKPLSGFKAITASIPEKGEVTFSVVSNSYELITNVDALEMGKTIHKKLFPDATSNSFEVFNVISPDTKSFCQIDIIDKNYALNIWEKEVYLPFIRIQNSYNRTRILKFDIGFCRKLCDNGVIFEQGTVSVNFRHTKTSFKGMDITNIDVSHLKRLEDDFIQHAKKSVKINLARKYFVPLAAKVLNRNFNLKEKNEEKRKLILEKLNEFILQIELYSDRYINTENMGETAYAFFNVITDYASNNDKLHANAINGLQASCGNWLNLIDSKVSEPKFSWEKEVVDYNYLLNRQ
ncbi:MAG: DUF932 domain-containing protein [Bacteroidales bacterium]